MTYRPKNDSSIRFDARRRTVTRTFRIRREWDDYHSATAKTIEEAGQLVESGFEYVCTYNNVMLFRKRK